MRLALPAWRAIGASDWVLRIIAQGLYLAIGEADRLSLLGTNQGRTVMDTQAHHDFMVRDIKRKVAEGVVDLHPLWQATEVASTRAFVIDKPNRLNEYRDINDLRPINVHLPKRPFKMEGLPTLSLFLKKGCWIATLDLKSAYHHIALSESTSRLVCFEFEGVLVVTKILPFGLSWSPWVFTKVFRTVVKHWRERGYLVILYLDDLILAAPTKEGLEAQMEEAR
jgi:hypothetical protein